MIMANKDIKVIYGTLVDDFKTSDNIADKTKLSAEIRALDEKMALGGYDLIDSKRLNYKVSQMMRDVDANDDISTKAKVWIKEGLQELVR